MIRSMTGYGEAASQNDGVSYFLEVRSLNSKYFKTTVRLPDEFQGLEAEIEASLRRRLARGSVTVKATCTDASAGAAQVVNHHALDAYVEQLQKSSHVGKDLSLDLGALLHLPGVLQQPANEEERTKAARGEFMGLLDRACDGLMVMRTNEGEALAEDLRSQRDVIASRLEIVESQAPAVVQEYERRLRTRIDSLLAEAGASAEGVDIIREVASFAERSDIAEEITRLRGHIVQFTDLIEGGSDADGANPKGVGRTLDFLAQEMLREANTMASKASDAALARAIVEIKGAIDRIKEQVQNVE